MLLCHVAHFLRRLYRVCGNKPSDIASTFFVEIIVSLGAESVVSVGRMGLLLSMMPCVLRHCSTVLPHFPYVYHDMFKIPSKLANCHPFLSPPRSNMEPEDYLSEEERKSAYQSLHSECSMLGFQDYNISKLKPIRIPSHLIRSCFNRLWQSPLLRYNSPKLLGLWGNCMKTYQ